MKKTFKAWVWLAIVALIACGGFFGYRRYKKMLVRQDLGDFLRVVSKGNLKLDLQVLGDLVSRDTVDVFPPNKGFVVEIFKKEGEYVEKGDKIMSFKGGERIDSDQYVVVPIVAPRAGLLTRCVSKYGQSGDEVRAGNRINSASECVMRVVDMKTLAVNLQINEIDIFKIKPNMPVNITFNSIPGEKFSGKVDLMAPMAESKGGYSNTSKVFRVVISIDKPVKQMRVGMSAIVTANIQSKKDVIKAPIETLFQEKLNHYVYRQTEGYEAEKIQIFPGMRSDTEVEMVGNIKPGDKLFTAVPDTLK